MIKAEVSHNAKVELAVNGNVAEVGVDLARLISAVLLTLHRKTGIPIRVLAESVGHVLPDAMTPMMQEGDVI